VIRMSTMKTEDFLDYVKETKSKNTFKEYKRGIAKFCEYYGKTPNEVLELRIQDWISGDLHRKKRFSREVEKFHAWLIDKQGYAINSARTYTLGILQLFRFYEMPVTIATGSDVSKTVISTKDFVPTSQQYRAMYQAADNLRDKLIIAMGLELGWRIGDFAKIRKEQLPNLDSEAPISFELITEKEDIIAKSFLSAETAQLLKEWLATLKDSTNPFLFPSNGQGHIDTDTVNNALRNLADKAGIKIPKRKRLRFHCMRKRFLSECANLSVDINTAKVLVGKSVSKDMLGYLSEVDHKAAFIKLHEKLRLVKAPIRKARESATDLEKRLDMLERMISLISAMNPELVRKADTMLKELGEAKLGKMPFTEKMRLIIEKQKAEQKEQYKKLIEANNNNGNNKGAK